MTNIPRHLVRTSQEADLTILFIRCLLRPFLQHGVLEQRSIQDLLVRIHVGHVLLVKMGMGFNCASSSASFRFRVEAWRKSMKPSSLSHAEYCRGFLGLRLIYLIDLFIENLQWSISSRRTSTSSHETPSRPHDLSILDISRIPCRQGLKTLKLRNAKDQPLNPISPLCTRITKTASSLAEPLPFLRICMVTDQYNGHAFAPAAPDMCPISCLSEAIPDRALCFSLAKQFGPLREQSDLWSTPLFRCKAFSPDEGPSPIALSGQLRHPYSIKIKAKRQRWG